MTGLVTPVPRDDDGLAPRPLVTIGISAAGLGGFVLLAMNLGWFTLAAAPAVTIADVRGDLASHHVETQKSSREQLEVLRDLKRLLQIDCIHHSKTDLERDQCVAVR